MNLVRTSASVQAKSGTLSFGGFFLNSLDVLKADTHGIRREREVCKSSFS